MIKNIKINNFRSILESSVDLESLTVIVGANATGKSNLIKAIDFISDVAEFGLQESIYKRGGFGEILPKQYKNIYDQEISIKIEFELETPKNWKEFDLPPLTAEYQIGFIRTKRSPLKITQEHIIANSILLLEQFITSEFDQIEDQKEINKKKLKLKNTNLEELIESRVKLFRGNRNVVQTEINFKLTKENNSLLLGWLGFGNFFKAKKERIRSGETLKLLKSIVNNAKPGVKKSDLPILSSNRAIFSFTSHFRKIINEIQSYGRYDLLINELRQEQSISTETKVSITGDNMPSVIKRFIKNNKDGWKRVLNTMSNISPYFANVFSESLRAGKEYLLFEEIFKGRSIEAWESSDGTLRALAILISVETHKNGSIVLIEEPEHGLHPWAVKELISHIREVISLHNIQVLLTTHSQQVLENIEKKELLITERDKNGTRYSGIDEIIPDADISMGEIGELWTRGLLRGVPTSI